MQTKKPIILHLPELLITELEIELKKNPPKWKYKIEYFHYLIHYLTVRHNKQKNNEFIAIDTQKLKEITVWNIGQYVNYLIKGEFLKRDYYIKGSKAFHYKINLKYSVGYKRIKLSPGSKLYTNIITRERLKRKHNNRLQPFLKEMLKHFNKIELDYEKARNWIKTQPNEKKVYSYLTSLSRLEDKRFRYFKQNKTNNRLDTNLTNLKSGLKQFIKGDFVHIDLANSQPFILSQLFERIGISLIDRSVNNKPLCCEFLEINIVKYFGTQTFKHLLKIPLNDLFLKSGELLTFQNSCVSGTFYDDFKVYYNKDNLSRKQLKEMMFSVLFSKNVTYKDNKRIVPYHKEKVIFSGVYNNLFEMIEILKDKNHRKLAVLLQRIESKIFIDTICPKLVDLGIIPLTIHDSIIVDTNRSEIALEVCKNTFQEVFGIVPKFHIKSLKPN